MMIAARLRQNFEAAGHRISQRDDVDEKAVAWLLEITPGALRNRRRAGRCPRFAKLPCGVRYRIDDVALWLLEQVEGGNESRCIQMHPIARTPESLA